MLKYIINILIIIKIYTDVVKEKPTIRKPCLTEKHWYMDARNKDGKPNEKSSRWKPWGSVVRSESIHWTSPLPNFVIPIYFDELSVWEC